MTEFYREQLETISQRAREGLLAFADRYVQAMRMAGLDPAGSDRTTHFSLRLPQDVRRQLKCFKLSAPFTVESVTLGNVYRETTTPLPISDRSSPSWCPRHQTSGHDASECRFGRWPQLADVGVSFISPGVILQKTVKRKHEQPPPPQMAT